MRGPKHDYVGMNIVFTGNGTACISMKHYIQQAIHLSEDVEGEIKRHAATPATKLLFTVDERSPPVTQKKAMVFHSIVAKFLYVAKRARIDLQPSIAFLCTRVKAPTEQDWGKMSRMLQYLKDTIDLKLILSADNIEAMHAWVDALYAVHHDMRSHTQGCISMGRGMVHSQSNKQKINTKSSTEAKLVGLSDYLPHSIWT